MKYNLLFFLLLVTLLCSISTQLSSAEVKETSLHPKLIRPIGELFSHPKHKKPFSSLGVSCKDCHTFSITSKEGVRGKGVEEKFLKEIPHSLCHRCHVEQVTFQRRNQCSICHLELSEIKPKDHKLDWIRRHGKMAMVDKDECSKCHKQTDCTECHLGRNSMLSLVHPGNFRYTHSIEARARPTKCITCHQSPSFCYECHSGKRK